MVLRAVNLLLEQNLFEDLEKARAIDKRSRASFIRKAISDLNIKISKGEAENEG